MNSRCPATIASHQHRTLSVRNVRLCGTPDDASAINKLYNVTCVDGKVVTVAEIDGNASEYLPKSNAGQVKEFSEVVDAKGLGILLPGYELQSFAQF